MLLHPKKQRSHSARPREQNSTPWGVVPVGTLLDPKELDPSKSENDRSARSRRRKKKRSSQDQERCSTPPCRASKRIKSKSRGDSFQEAATEFSGCVDPKNRGKRSVRPRGNKPAASTSWSMSQLSGFHNLGTTASRLGNADRNAGSETRGGTAASSGDVSKDVAKVFEEEKKDDSGIERSNAVAMVNAVAEVKHSGGEDANGTDGQAGATVAPPETSFDVKDDGNNHADANALVKRMGILITGAAAEMIRVSNGADANSVVHTGVPATDTLPDLEESNGSVADIALDKTAVQTNNDFDPLKDRANDAAEFDSKTISALDLDDGNVNFDLPSAESALASLYGESDRDMCIEFAVKLLMNETPLPKEAAEIEEFFTQKLHGEKTAKRQRKEEPSNVCSAWGSLQSDKLLLTSRC